MTPADMIMVANAAIQRDSTITLPNALFSVALHAKDKRMPGLVQSLTPVANPFAKA